MPNFILISFPLLLFLIYCLVILFTFVYTGSIHIIKQLHVTSKWICHFVLLFYLSFASVYITELTKHKVDEYKEYKARMLILVKKGKALEEIQQKIRELEAAIKLNQLLDQIRKEKEIRNKIKEV